MVVVAARILIRTVLLAALSGALLIMLVFIVNFVLDGFQGAEDTFISIAMIVLCVIVICGSVNLLGWRDKAPESLAHTMHETIYGEEASNSHEMRGY